MAFYLSNSQNVPQLLKHKIRNIYLSQDFIFPLVLKIGGMISSVQLYIIN
jgi:hypothetical protein